MSNLDVRRVADWKTLISIVDPLYPDVTDGRAAGVLLATFGSSTPIAVFPRSFPAPPWCYADLGDTVVVVVTGVTTITDGLSLLKSTMQPLSASGSWSANSLCLSSAFQMLAILNLAFTGAARRWVLYGHSYGGGIVQVLAALLGDADPSRSIQVLTTGSPRPGDSSLVARLAQFTMRRLMNDNDPIPRFPPQLAEAPTATIAIGFIVAAIWSQYVQPYGGVELSPMGELHSAQVPGRTLPITDFNLSAWAVGFNGFRASGHTTNAYAGRVALALTNPANSAWSPPLAFGPESPQPLTQAGFNLAAAVVAGNLSSPTLQGANVPAYIPVQYRAKAVKVGTSYQVTWLNFTPVVGTTKSNARSIAKYLNAFTRRLQTAKSADHTQIGNALQAYLVAAGSVSAGFLPTLTVT